MWVHVLPVILGLDFLLAVYPGIAVSQVWSKSVLVCCSLDERIHQRGPSEQGGKAWNIDYLLYISRNLISENECLCYTS